MTAILQALFIALRIQSDVLFQEVKTRFAIIFASVYAGVTILIGIQAFLNSIGAAWAKVTIFALGWMVNGLVLLLALNPGSLLYWGLGTIVLGILNKKDAPSKIASAMSLLITKAMASVALVVGIFTMYLTVFPFGEQAFIAVPLAFTLSLFGYWAMWAGHGKMFEMVTLRMLIALVLVLVAPLLVGLTFEWTGKDMTTGKEGRAAVEVSKANYRNVDRSAAIGLDKIRQKIESGELPSGDEVRTWKASLDRKESREILSRGKALVFGRSISVRITPADFRKGCFIVSGLEPMTSYAFSADDAKVRIWVNTEGSNEYFETSLRDGRQTDKKTPYDSRYTWALYADGVRSGEEVRANADGKVKVEWNTEEKFRNLFRIDAQNITLNFH